MKPYDLERLQRMLNHLEEVQRDLEFIERPVALQYQLENIDVLVRLARYEVSMISMVQRALQKEPEQTA